MPTLDVAVASSVNKPSIRAVSTTHSRVVAVAAMIDPVRLVIEVEHGIGTGENFQAEAKELWLGMGPNVINLLGQNASGTHGDALRALATQAVTAIEGNPTLKANMQASGALKIVRGSLIDMFSRAGR